MLALSAIAGMLPQAVLGLFVGVYIDRWDRKRTMILADSFIALCTLGLAVLFWLDAAELWHVYLLLACRSAGSAFHVPAMQASVPLLAPKAQLTRIAGVNQVISSLSDIAGPALGAPAAEPHLDREHPAVRCRRGTRCLHDAALRPDPESRTPGAPPGPVARIPRRLHRHALPTGFGLVLRPGHRRMVPDHAVGVLFPLMTLNHFGGGTWEMSFVEIIWGGGALLGGAIMGARNYPVNRIVLINLMYLVVGLRSFVRGCFRFRDSTDSQY